ncbi:MAG: tetraacyldisaccharide 4'-kinase [Gammaproteobacteria bacterium]|nr:tetraacyldisaccharide 4'-kinase [Gammaproteobacteria bacterium]
MEEWLNRIWYERRQPPAWLLPFEWLFIGLSGFRRFLYQRGVKTTESISLPVIVVGNIAVGGTGKTPLVRHLVSRLQAAGIKPGIVSRGYGGARRSEPLIVHPDDSATDVGDEPLWLAEATGAPVAIFPKRARAARHLANNRDIDVVICDDGLQHYSLARDLEIVVIDGARGLGNGHRLPAGPLRESRSRLQEVDLVIAQGDDELPGTSVNARMHLQPSAFVHLVDGERREISAGIPEDFRKGVLAVAGIGNPQRFFATVDELGIDAETRKFADHHPFSGDDLEDAQGRPVIMTAKDAVKCREFARPGWWYLDVEAYFDRDPVDNIISRLVELRRS